MKETALNLARTWANDQYFDEADRNEITSLLKNYALKEEEVTDRFYQDLEFGTGGLRSIIGMGSNRINKYNVRKAVQAMADVALADNPKDPKAAVSYDCRNFSFEFAKEVASVFARNGIKTYIFSDLTPTPMLSYAVRYYGCVCGVMITASHNPKAYNGFKAYWSDGSQVTPPEDANIIKAYGNIKDWNQVKTTDFNDAVKENMIEWIGEEVNESFYKIIENISLNPKMIKDNPKTASFVYTPLHGTGYIPCKTISERMGFENFHIIKDQAVFDGNFSTVETTPNPEDPKALKFAVEKMIAIDADVAYGTDPDGDRLGVVVNQNGKAEYLNGNQLGFLMIDYIFSELKKQNKLPSNPLVLKSIVTSGLQNNIVESFGGTVIDTLTGFKWMARKWRDLEQAGTDYNFVYASEESFGYMTHDKARDKDAVGAMAMMNEITLFHKLAGKTLVDALDDIYEKYGYAQESLIANTYAGISGREKINSIMSHFRTNFKDQIADEETEIFMDFESQKEINLLTGAESKIDMTKSNVLGFKFKSGNQLFLRPSGTEPKIKFYTMIKVSEGDLASKKAKAKERIETIESFIHKAIENL
jgi:phosphoglucomutase